MKISGISIKFNSANAFFGFSFGFNRGALERAAQGLGLRVPYEGPRMRGVCEASHAVQVAQQLGWRSRRRPTGYWESEEHLDHEIAQFVAAHWSRMEHPDSGETYGYNQVRVNLTPGWGFFLPPSPQALDPKPCD